MTILPIAMSVTIEPAMNKRPDRRTDERSSFRITEYPANAPIIGSVQHALAIALRMPTMKEKTNDSGP
jgi:hypothetical protein